MIIQFTEFGKFFVTVDGDKRLLYLDNIFIGYLSSPWIDTDTNTTVSITISKIIEIYLDILRFESKNAMFFQTPTSNEFKDAMLRMQVENQGQSLNLRDYVDNDFLPTREWIVYPKNAEIYDLSSYTSETLIIITPYGLYRFLKIDDETYRVTRFYGGVDKIVSDIKVPYMARSYIALDIELVAILQSIESIRSDILDIIDIKTNEIAKRFSESLKYLFGYDKLRRAIRKRGVS